jgi:hypothetical protein
VTAFFSKAEQQQGKEDQRGIPAHHCVRLLRRKAFRKRSRNRVLERRKKIKETKGIVPYFPLSGCVLTKLC